MNINFIQRGGLWIAGQTGLMLAVGVLGIVFQAGQKSGALIAAGCICAGLGAGCGIAGVLALGRNLTPFPKPMEHAQLVQTGIYRVMRHPLYTAVISGALGWTLLWQSGPGLAAVLLLAFFLDAKARHEERWLQQRFPGYAAYAQRVRRFMPGIY